MTILVALDESAASRRALDTGVRLARALDEPLYAVHLVGEASADSDAHDLAREMRERLADESGVEATVDLEHVARDALRSGTRVGKEILEIAVAAEITHVVMGHSAEGLVGDLLHGSAAHTVADHAEVPVTIVT
ncbi:MAG: universal stress protein [Halobacteriaceae archaeon]